MKQPIFAYEVCAPSNIAFVKYWGKLDGQIPMNPSVSMTLKNCVTQTSFEFFESETLEVELKFNGEENEVFEKRVYQYLLNLCDKYRALNSVKVCIATSNNFPHSAGIASSASGFSAIAMGVWNFLKQREPELESASSLARLGSGSASRSIEGPFCLWEQTEAVKIKKIQMPELSDVIILIDKGQKSHSSSFGHQLMNQHPYRESRIKNANRNCEEAVQALKEGDFTRLGKIIEAEALELHALMMTSAQPFWLIRPESLEVMEYIREQREKGLEAYFTLDAGANVHIISRLVDQERVVEALTRKFPDTDLLRDQQGIGIKVLS